MDIGNFQEYFGKTGYLTRIDLFSDEKTAERIRTVLPSHLCIEKKEELFNNQKALIASFQYNLQFGSLIAILAGIFLLYNTVFISVIKRRTEIGILRGLGTDKKTVILLFAVQGLVLGTHRICSRASPRAVCGIFFSHCCRENNIHDVQRHIRIRLSSDVAAMRSSALLLGLHGITCRLHNPLL